MTQVLITGGTGLVGRHLTEFLTGKGYRVSLLSRSVHPGSEVRSYTWDIRKNEIEEESLRRADFIIHLAGVNIGGKRWTRKRRSEILESRVRSAGLLYRKVREMGLRPKAFVTASAVGYYGSLTVENELTEEEPPGVDFPGRVCTEWESVADRFSGLGIRSAKIRSGIVLAKESGLLKRLDLPVRLGIGSAMGTGNQYLPWIHPHDLCGIYLKVLEDPGLSGSFNAVAPEQVTSEQFSRVLARIRNRKIWLPGIPAVLLKTAFGEMSSMLIHGSRISPQKIMQSGYEFRYPMLWEALEEIFSLRTAAS